MKYPDRFTCEEAFRRLDDYLDRELGVSEMARVRDHLDTCAACAREFTFEASVLEGLKTKIRKIDMPPEVLARITAAIDAA
ncbi:MAG: zf-HC2 domain-containing protein [Gemmatimonadota bacterium]